MPNKIIINVYIEGFRNQSYPDYKLESSYYKTVYRDKIDGYKNWIIYKRNSNKKKFEEILLD